MRLQKLELYQFRCFKQKVFDLDHDIIIVHGKNGTGKTSLIEALYYICHARSFKTRVVSELVYEQENHFSVIAQVQNIDQDMHDTHVITCAYVDKKKNIKIDQRSIRSYKELVRYSQVVSVTQEDIDLVKGGPGGRRDFLDEVLMLYKPELLELLKKYQKVLEQRNALLGSDFVDEVMYDLWTQKLYELTVQIQAERDIILQYLVQESKTMLPKVLGDAVFMRCLYQKKEDIPHIDPVLYIKNKLFYKERILQRSLFGAHLDDVSIEYLGKNAKIFGSRGQQKLLVLALKLSVISLLQRKNIHPILLLDDFITDFDDLKITKIIHVLESIDLQIIVTTPQAPEALAQSFMYKKPCIIELL